MESGLVLFNGDDSKNCGFGQRKQRYCGDHQSPENHRHSKIATSSKRSKRAAMKRVVSVPIKVVERARGDHKSGDGAPPADCWTWRKYGQKPIKGSPYPRGYYRCSSSKGCPARKQVERSYMDPTMLVITYSSDHNHSSPPAASRNQPSNKNIKQLSAAPDKAAISNRSNVELEELKQVEDEFGWLTGLQSAAPSSSFMMMESTVFGADFLLPAVASEEESLFADLGELPECSAVFRRRATEDVSMVYADESWCETTSSSLRVTEDCFNTTS